MTGQRLLPCYEICFLLPFGSFLFTVPFCGMYIILASSFYSLLGVSVFRKKVFKFEPVLTFYSLLGVSLESHHLAYIQFFLFFLSTPFWEFQSVGKRVTLLCISTINFLLPFGSFLY